MFKIGDLITFKGNEYVVQAVKPSSLLVSERDGSVIYVIAQKNECEKVGHIELFNKNVGNSAEGERTIVIEGAEGRTISTHNDGMFNWELVSSQNSAVEFTERFKVEGNRFSFKESQIVMDVIHCEDGDMIRYKLVKPMWIKLQTEGKDVVGLRRDSHSGTYGYMGYCHFSDTLCVGNFGGVMQQAGSPIERGMIIESTLLSSNERDSVGFEISGTRSAYTFKNFLGGQKTDEWDKRVNIMHYDKRDWKIEALKDNYSRMRWYEGNYEEEIKIIQEKGYMI